jgi:hypothetical protein
MSFHPPFAPDHLHLYRWVPCAPKWNRKKIVADLLFLSLHREDGKELLHAGTLATAGAPPPPPPRHRRLPNPPASSRPRAHATQNGIGEKTIVRLLLPWSRGRAPVRLVPDQAAPSSSRSQGGAEAPTRLPLACALERAEEVAAGDDDDGSSAATADDVDNSSAALQATSAAVFGPTKKSDEADSSEVMVAPPRLRRRRVMTSSGKK